ncbi:MAG: hypothetical protein U5K74_02730 [Gemmatimonadaceae bacterium]|nr:hypothetical protein [Gemmatimonadaceae bacterium]
MKFSQELAEGSPFRARPCLAGKDPVTLVRDIMALDQDAFSGAFRKSPMKRAKLAGRRRNAAVVLEHSRVTPREQRRRYGVGSATRVGSLTLRAVLPVPSCPRLLSPQHRS